MLRTLTDQPTKKDAKYLLALLEAAIGDIYCEDFVEEKLLRRSDLIRPSLGVSKILEREAVAARRDHERYPRQTAYKATTADPDSADWIAQARSFLFRSKRASTLAKLLATKRSLIALGLEQPTRAGLRRVLGDPRGRHAIATIIRSARARHVGIDMLDITVCGAIPPYASVLGGKLVSLLMFSPEVVMAYKKRYDPAVSLIASAVKGAAVVRKPHLVLLGTTSLYGVTSSQYNRLQIPRAVLGASARDDLRYELLGRTEGFGSYHFSQATLECAQIVASQGREGRRINSIFGEGVSQSSGKFVKPLRLPDFLLTPYCGTAVHVWFTASRLLKTFEKFSLVGQRDPAISCVLGPPTLELTLFRAFGGSDGLTLESDATTYLRQWLHTLWCVRLGTALVSPIRPNLRSFRSFRLWTSCTDETEQRVEYFTGCDRAYAEALSIVNAWRDVLSLVALVEP